jgi:hypothetical protein
MKNSAIILFIIIIVGLSVPVTADDLFGRKLGTFASIQYTPEYQLLFWADAAADTAFPLLKRKKKSDIH